MHMWKICPYLGSECLAVIFLGLAFDNHMTKVNNKQKPQYVQFLDVASTRAGPHYFLAVCKGEK